MFLYYDEMSHESTLKDTRNSEITEIIEDPVKIQSYIWEVIGAAKEEVLILLSSAKAFARQENAGSIEILKKLCSMKKDLTVRVLTPKSDHVEEVRSEIKKLYSNFGKIPE